ncbi:general secretion pathway protein GspB [Ferrimonas lipolytica]|uniref:General secretion pathway protein GspB n=1 Tax=Ferrimonas lipolytica TaxID=2724191 RepID=A0A6H1UHY3_9GAMM|nr:general secretion pathway protein GspB [Ferrimonas lipolytica]QIZ77923.1 general secretion pathway protein GspB [Ferrimonas lipolytica]
MLDIIKVMMLMLALPAAANSIDPTEPPSWSIPVVKQQQAKGELESIVIQGKQRLVIIGGKSYREGDRWGQQRIRTIHRDQVVLSDGSKLSLFPQISEMSQEH